MSAARPMQVSDATAVLALQQAAYPASHHESWAVLGRKLQLWPAGCWVLEDVQGLLAYLFSHPGLQDSPPLLHAPLDLPAQADAYALHDLALHPRAQGRGLGRQMFALALQQAQAAALPVLSLVAVQGSVAFWSRLGFEAVMPPPPQLSSYGGEAVFMRRPAAPVLESAPAGSPAAR